MNRKLTKMAIQMICQVIFQQQETLNEIINYKYYKIFIFLNEIINYKYYKMFIFLCTIKGEHSGVHFQVIYNITQTHLYVLVLFFHVLDCCRKENLQKVRGRDICEQFEKHLPEFCYDFVT